VYRGGGIGKHEPTGASSARQSYRKRGRRRRMQSRNRATWSAGEVIQASVQCVQRQLYARLRAELLGIEQRDPQFRVVWRSVRCNLECVFFGRHGIQNPRIAYLQKRRFHLVDRRRLFLRAADRLPVAIRPDNVHLVAIHPYSGQSCVQHSFVFRNERVQCGQLRAACANQRACQVKISIVFRLD
jgi:hypothetical protein